MKNPKPKTPASSPKPDTVRELADRIERMELELAFLKAKLMTHLMTQPQTPPIPPLPQPWRPPLEPWHPYQGPYCRPNIWW
jgi:hypothetical protein